MCLLIVAFERHDDYRLVVAANRDEFYTRPARPAHFWPDYPHILGGRDEEGGGTWLGVNRRGAFAALTNVRKPGTVANPRSRGLIVTDYLDTAIEPARFVDGLHRTAGTYNGFNIIASDLRGLAWYSNRADEPRSLPRDVYGLSNDLLDTPWPKVVRLKQSFSGLESTGAGELERILFAALADEQVAGDHELPDTGIDRGYERTLSSIFISGETYGTRCSTLVFIGYDDTVTFIERRYGPHKTFLGESRFQFEIEGHGT